MESDAYSITCHVIFCAFSFTSKRSINAAFTTQKHFAASLRAPLVGKPSKYGSNASQSRCASIARCFSETSFPVFKVEEEDLHISLAVKYTGVGILVRPAQEYQFGVRLAVTRKRLSEKICKSKNWKWTGSISSLLLMAASISPYIDSGKTAGAHMRNFW